MNEDHIIHNKNELIIYIEKMKVVCKSFEIAHERLFSSDGWMAINAKMRFDSPDTQRTYERIIQSMYVLYALSAIIGATEKYYPRRSQENQKLWDEDIYIILKIIRNGLAHDLTWSHDSYENRLPIAYNGLTYTTSLNDTVMDLQYCNHNLVIGLIDKLVKILKQDDFV